MRGCLTSRDARAPSAMLNDVCRRRSMPRTSMRLATLAQTISSTNPVTIIRIWSQCSYCSRMLVMPAPPGLRNRVCSGNFARSLALISPQCERSHCFSSTRISASIDAGDHTWLDAADQVQPVSVVLVEIGIGLDERFGVQRKKEIGRSAAQSVAKETRRSDSHDGKRLVIQIEDAADYGRIRPRTFAATSDSSSRPPAERRADRPAAVSVRPA